MFNTIAPSEKETEVHNRKKEDILELIVAAVVSDLITGVVEADSYNHTLAR